MTDQTGEIPAADAGPDAADGTPSVQRGVMITNRRGLHARAAAKFVKLADCFDSAVVVRRNGAEVCGSSIMGLMMLAAGPGTALELSASGPDAAAAIEALADLIARKFDED